MPSLFKGEGRTSYPLMPINFNRMDIGSLKYDGWTSDDWTLWNDQPGAGLNGNTYLQCSGGVETFIARNIPDGISFPIKLTALVQANNGGQDGTDQFIVSLQIDDSATAKTIPDAAATRGILLEVHIPRWRSDAISSSIVLSTQYGGVGTIWQEVNIDYMQNPYTSGFGYEDSTRLVELELTSNSYAIYINSILIASGKLSRTFNISDFTYFKLLSVNGTVASQYQGYLGVYMEAFEIRPDTLDDLDNTTLDEDDEFDDNFDGFLFPPPTDPYGNDPPPNGGGWYPYDNGNPLVDITNWNYYEQPSVNTNCMSSGESAVGINESTAPSDIGLIHRTTPTKMFSFIATFLAFHETANLTVTSDTFGIIVDDQFDMSYGITSNQAPNFFGVDGTFDTDASGNVSITTNVKYRISNGTITTLSTKTTEIDNISTSGDCTKFSLKLKVSDTKWELFLDRSGSFELIDSGTNSNYIPSDLFTVRLRIPYGNADYDYAISRFDFNILKYVSGSSEVEIDVLRNDFENFDPSNNNFDIWDLISKGLESWGDIVTPEGDKDEPIPFSGLSCWYTSNVTNTLGICRENIVLDSTVSNVVLEYYTGFYQNDQYPTEQTYTFLQFDNQDNTQGFVFDSRDTIKQGMYSIGIAIENNHTSGNYSGRIIVEYVDDGGIINPIFNYALKSPFTYQWKDTKYLGVRVYMDSTKFELWIDINGTGSWQKLDTFIHTFVFTPTNFTTLRLGTEGQNNLTVMDNVRISQRKTFTFDPDTGIKSYSLIDALEGKSAGSIVMYLNDFKNEIPLLRTWLGTEITVYSDDGLVELYRGDIFSMKISPPNQVMLILRDKLLRLGNRFISYNPIVYQGKVDYVNPNGTITSYGIPMNGKLPSLGGYSDAPDLTNKYILFNDEDRLKGVRHFDYENGTIKVYDPVDGTNSSLTYPSSTDITASVAHFGSVTRTYILDLQYSQTDDNLFCDIYKQDPLTNKGIDIVYETKIQARDKFDVVFPYKLKLALQLPHQGFTEAYQTPPAIWLYNYTTSSWDKVSDSFVSSLYTTGQFQLSFDGKDALQRPSLVEIPIESYDYLGNEQQVNQYMKQWTFKFAIFSGYRTRYVEYKGSSFQGSIIVVAYAELNYSVKQEMQIFPSYDTVSSNTASSIVTSGNPNIYSAGVQYGDALFVVDPINTFINSLSLSDFILDVTNLQKTRLTKNKLDQVSYLEFFDFVNKLFGTRIIFENNTVKFMKIYTDSGVSLTEADIIEYNNNAMDYDIDISNLRTGVFVFGRNISETKFIGSNYNVISSDEFVSVPEIDTGYELRKIALVTARRHSFPKVSIVISVNGNDSKYDSLKKGRLVSLKLENGTVAGFDGIIDTKLLITQREIVRPEGTNQTYYKLYLERP